MTTPAVSSALVDVLSAAFGPGVNVTADDVRPYLGEAGGVPSYLLTNAIETGDPAAALETLHRLLTVSSPQQPKPMHPLQVMGLLNGYYRRILRLDDPSLRSPADAIAALGGKVKEYPARKALDQARSLGSGGIRQAFDALFQADLDLKGARGIPEQAVMEVLVVRLARLSARTGGGRADGAGDSVLVVSDTRAEQGAGARVLGCVARGQGGASSPTTRLASAHVGGPAGLPRQGSAGGAGPALFVGSTQVYEPDRTWDIDHVLAEDDLVTLHCTMHARTTAGNEYHGSYHMLFRIEGGTIAEAWEFLDTAYVFECMQPPTGG